MEPKNLEDLYVRSRSEGFGQEVKKRIMLGSYVLSEAYYDAYFTKAQQVRRLIKDYMDTLFKDYDFVILPTCTRTTWRKDEVEADPLEVYMSDIYTVLANICGCAAISMPLGKDMDNKPYGIQFMAGVGNDNKLLNWLAKL
jgi:aspartyl-tRNA(Asn)/glutamyl-tRNA(Gln) amidotransferase subunit A